MFEPTALARLNSVEHAQAISFRDVARFVRNSLSTILGCVFVCLCLGTAFCLVAKPRYAATAQILIEPAQTPAVLQEPNARSAATLETETGRIESQIQVIRSAQIAREVIRRLGLLDETEFKLRETGPPIYAPLLDLFRPAKPADTIDPATRRMNHAVDLFGNQLVVRRLGQSFVVEVQFSAENPVTAGKATNAILDAYIDADIAAKADSARRGSVWLNQRLDELRGQVAESRGALERFKSTSDIQNASERAVRFAQLESVAQSQSRLYDAFLARALETVQKISYPVADARVIGEAPRPEAKSFPKVGLTLAFSGLVGAAAGIGVAMLRRAADRRLRTAKDVANAVNAPILGVVAQFPGTKLRSAFGRQQQVAGTAARARGLSLNRQAINEFRALKVALNTSLLTRPMRLIGLTSPGSGEGKTTVALMLGAMLAHSDLRVLLVDLCHGNATLSRSITPEGRDGGGEEGVQEYLTEPERLSQLVVRHPDIANLSLLPVGRMGGQASPAERLASPRHRADLAALGKTFDLVLLDMPGTQEAPEILTLAPSLDAVIVVVAHASTTLDALEDSVHNLRGGRADVLGLVINKADLREIRA